jgi:hypothetical protein
MNCVMDACTKEQRAKGYCSTHYQRLRRHGDVAVVNPRGYAPRPAIGRVMAKLVPSGDCLLYLGREWGPQGGYFQVLTRDADGTKRNRLAHRIVYEAAYGPIPAGMEIRHTCDRPTCCELTHLVIGTRTQNEADKNPRRIPEDRRRTTPIVQENALLAYRRAVAKTG